MPHLYLASHVYARYPFNIVVYADNAKEARRFVKINFKRAFAFYEDKYRLNEDISFLFVRSISSHLKTPLFPVKRITNLLQLPKDWENSIPYGYNHEENIINVLTCKKIIQLKEEDKVKKKNLIDTDGFLAKEKELFEQAKRLDGLLKKRKVDALFLYGLVEHGLSDDILECWKRYFFKKRLEENPALSFIESGDKTVNVYVDNKAMFVWVQSAFDLGESFESEIVRAVSECGHCTNYRGIKNKFYYLFQKINVKNCNYPDVAVSRMMAIGGINIIRNKLSYKIYR